MPEDPDGVMKPDPPAPAPPSPATEPAALASGRRLGLQYIHQSDGVVTLSWSVDLKRSKRLMRRLFRLPPVDANLVIIILLPLVVLFLDSNVFFAKPGWLDTWIYHSFFRHLFEFKSFLFPNTYYGSRMSWIVPGYIINRFFHPVAANYLLHLGVYYVGAFSLYYILTKFYNRPTALLGLIAFTCNPYLWGAIGTDYVDGFGVATYLLTFAILARIAAGGGSSRVGLVLAGATYAALIYTNTIWLLFSPAFLLLYLFLRRLRNISEITRATVHFGLWFAAGAGAITAVLGVINYRIDGHFWFYLPSIAYTLENATKPQPWHSTNYAWVGSAHWLIYPAVMLLASVVVLMRRPFTGKRDVPRMTRFFRMHFLFSVLVFVLLELKGLYMLEWSFYASYLIPATFLFAGAELFEIAGQTKPSVIALFFAVVLFLAWFGLGPAIWATILKTGLPAVLCVAAGAILLRAAMPGNGAALAACLIGFGLLNVYGRGSNGLYSEQADGPNHRGNAFVRMTESVEAIDQARHGGPVVFWFNSADPHSDEFDSINSFFLWGYTWIGRAFPAIDPVANERVTTGKMVAVLSTDEQGPQLLEKANRSLKPRGLAATWVTRREINYGGVRYGVTCLNLVRDPDLLRPLTATFDGQSGEARISEAANDRGTALPLDKWRAADKDAVIERTNDGLEIRTGSGSRVSYGAIYSRVVVSEDGKFLFTLNYHLIEGHIAFGALTEDRSSWLGQVGDVSGAGADGVLEYLVNLRKGQKAWLLITNNRPRESRASRLVVRQLRAYEFAKAAPQPLEPK